MVVGFGMAGAAAAGSCLAREAAVGAVNREETSRGLVTSRGFGLGAACLLAAALSAAAARATEAAVGAVREARLVFLPACVVGLGEVTVDAGEGTFGDKGVRGWLAGDLSAFDDLGMSLVVMPDSLPLPLAVGACLEVFVTSGLRKSSASGASAAPPLTASSLAGSAGLMLAGSSSTPVTGLSGLPAGLSTLGAPSCWSTSTNGVGAADSMADSGMVSPTVESSSRRACSVEIVSRRAPAATPSMLSLKLARRSPLLLSRWSSELVVCVASAGGFPLGSAVVAMLKRGSTATKLERIREVRGGSGEGDVFSRLPNRPGDLPRVSGEFSDALFSKSDRRLRTADEDRSADIS